MASALALALAATCALLLVAPPYAEGHGYLATPRSRNLLAFEETSWNSRTADDPMPEVCPQCELAVLAKLDFPWHCYHARHSSVDSLTQSPQIEIAVAKASTKVGLTCLDAESRASTTTTLPKTHWGVS